MDTKHLSIFARVYECRSINMASKTLYMSSQGVGKVIAHLETELNTKLFKRTPAGVIPTEYADRLYSHTALILAELENIERLEPLPRKELVIGCTTGITRILSLKFLYDFKEKYPDIPIRLYDNTDAALIKMLDEEELNLAILSMPVDLLKYTGRPFTTCDICVITNINSPIAHFSEISMEDLKNEPLVISSRDYSIYQARRNKLHAHSQSSSMIIESTDPEFHVQSASRGYASALIINLPEFIGNAPDIKIIPFCKEDAVVWNTMLTYKTDKILSDEELTFYRFAVSWLQKNRPELIRK